MNYKHIKTGNIYKIVGKALNTTNGQKEQEMVIYQNSDGMLFCKELKEF